MNRRQKQQIYCFFFITISICPHLTNGFSFLSGSKTPIIEVDTLYDIRPIVPFSLTPPYYLVRGSIPNWEFGGSTVVSDEWIRLTPSEKSLNGFIWNQQPIPFDSWEVELDFKIWSEKGFGADGMAFWYISQIPTNDGPVFGGPASWNGLGIFFDTFDNDGQGDQPSISVFVNDGSFQFSVGSDGKAQTLGSCKNLHRGYETFTKIQYFDGNLQVLTKVPGMKNNYELCTRVKAQLPSRYFMGVTAATGGVSDNHDLFSLSFRKLVSKIETRPGMTPPKENFEDEQQQQKALFEQQQQQKALFEQQQQQKAPVEQPQQIDMPTEQGDRYDTVSQKLKNLKEKLEKSKKEDSEDNEPPSHPHTQEAPKPQYEEIPQQVENPAVKDIGVDQQFQKAEANNQGANFAQPVNQNGQQPIVPPTDPSLVGILQTVITDVRALKNSQTQLENILKEVQSSVNDYWIAQGKNAATLDEVLSRQAIFSSAIEEMARVGQSGTLNGVLHKIQAVNTELEMVKNLVNSRHSFYDNTLRNLQAVIYSVNELKNRVEDTKNGQQQLSQALKISKEELQETITSSSSYGFWIYFTLFQLSFAFAFVWWRQYRAETRKKLF